MLLNNYLKLKQETLLLILLFIFSFFVRIPIIIFLGDTSVENEWEFLLYNLVNHNTFHLILLIPLHFTKIYPGTNPQVIKIY